MTDHLAIIVGVLGVGVCLLVLWRGRGAGRRAADEATDISTGLRTRRRFDLDVAAHAALGDEPTAIVLIDIDPARTPGDPAGGSDEVLQVVGAVVARLIRRGDVAYRYGGERFSVLLPATDAPAAALVAERIRRSIETAALPFDRRTTISAGVASGAAADVTTIVDRADALLAARCDGRNTVSIA